MESEFLILKISAIIGKQIVNGVVEEEQVLLDKTETNLNVEMTSYKNYIEGDEILDVQIKLAEASTIKKGIHIINQASDMIFLYWLKEPTKTLKDSVTIGNRKMKRNQVLRQRFAKVFKVFLRKDKEKSEKKPIST